MQWVHNKQHRFYTYKYLQKKKKLGIVFSKLMKKQNQKEKLTVTLMTDTHLLVASMVLIQPVKKKKQRSIIYTLNAML